MAIAHVCLQCGFDLARTRPASESHYGLPLVTCPYCGGYSVRRRHPIDAAWRTFRKFDIALLVIGVQIAAAVTASLSSLFLAFTVLNDFHTLEGEDRILFFMIFGVTALFTGIWLTVGFQHLQQVKARLLWTALLVSVFMLILVIVQASDLPGPVATWPQSIKAVVCLVAIQIAAILGVWPGKLLIRVIAQARHTLWRWRRRRLRSQRTGA